MTFLVRLYREIWGRVISATSLNEETHNAYRKLFVFFSLLIFVPNLMWIHQIPDLLFNPPKLSFVALFSGFPNHFFLLLFHIIVVFSLILIGLNKYKREVGILCFISLIVLSGFKYSFGKIDHIILYPFAVLCLSLTNWRPINSTQTKRSLLPIPGETLLAIFIGFGMFTAGILKAYNWVDFDTEYSGFLGWFYPGYYNMGRTHLFADVIFYLPEILIESLDYFAVLFELSPFLFLLTGKKTFWKIWVVLACFFHLSNTALLNIPFTYHLLVFLLFVLPISLVKLINNISNRVFTYSIFFIGFIQIGLLIAYEQPMIDLLFADSQSRIYIDFILWLLVYLVGLWNLIEIFKNRRLSNTHV